MRLPPQLSRPRPRFQLLEEPLWLPEEKANKIRILLQEFAYDTGNTRIALRDVQVLRGT